MTVRSGPKNINNQKLKLISTLGLIVTYLVFMGPYIIRVKVDQIVQVS